MKQTVKIRCPICERVIEPKPVVFDAPVLVPCPHCGVIVELDVK